VDTYDTLRGVDRAIAAAGAGLGGIRLDSGDHAALSRGARARLDAAGLAGAQVIVSDDMNEYRIRRLLGSGAPIDGFGVGTEVVCTPDMPALGAVYKLVEVEDGRGARVPVAKRSERKQTFPGAKQVWRRCDGRGRAMGDEIALADEAPREGEPLLVRVMEGGAIARDPPPLAAVRERALAQIAALPEGLLEIGPDAGAATEAAYPVTRTAASFELLERAKQMEDGHA
jgi:nicotinate phosphoribosyltransferase